MNGDKREETDRDRRRQQGGATKKPTGEDGSALSAAVVTLVSSRFCSFSPLTRSHLIR